VQQSAEVVVAKKADESPKEQRTEEPRDRPTKGTLVKERRSLLKQEGNDQEKINTRLVTRSLGEWNSSRSQARGGEPGTRRTKVQEGAE